MSTASSSEHAEAAHGHEHPKWLAHHFDSPAQQFDTAKLGMWIFICTEILMFGGLFVAYGIFRGQEPEMFHAAHEHLNWRLGAVNTIVLLFSSLTAALAVRQSQVGDRKGTTRALVLTLICAVAFLCIKYVEYTAKLDHGLLPGRCFGHPWFGDHCVGGGAAVLPAAVHGLSTRAHMFFAIYFMMTGLHGVHVLVGMGVLGWVLMRNLRGDFSKEYFTAVEIGALYWHLVDLVWIYLFPLLYLVG
jgi:cytochrome c oxidase subunit III